MKKYRRFAFALLTDAVAAQELRAMQMGVALHFPVHTTVRGRFSVESFVDMQDLLEFGKSVIQPLLPLTGSFHGPIASSTKLTWLECRQHDPGYAKLFEIHSSLNRGLWERKWIKIDDVPDSHQGVNYRPHITLIWSDIEADWLIHERSKRAKLPFEKNVVFRDWCVFRYRTAPEQADVEVVQIGKIQRAA